MAQVSSLPMYTQAFATEAGKRIAKMQLLNNVAEAFLAEQRNLFRAYNKLKPLSTLEKNRYAASVLFIASSIRNGKLPVGKKAGELISPNDCIVLAYKANGEIGKLRLSC